ncbi:hypothetical protein F511_28612 [Dorcoceras hygrometricum]|uniref:Acyl-CoA dehydrogenase-related protein n=1 Tax=Dorcoceras hygrometricum TaxID=472368 RepID=A0A2Z7D3X8_9LAMI|nr:hypothetical protein F511_28612 [Dorcoceras hygrometricum]
MSLFDLQDVCIAIGSIATLDLPMVVDLIGIYGLKGPYCTLTTTNWFLQALSVIPRGSWGDVARRFTMIRWAALETAAPLLSQAAAAAASTRRRRRRRLRRKIVSGQFDEENPFMLISSVLLVQTDEGVSFLVVDRIGDFYRNLPRRADVIVTTIESTFGSKPPRRRRPWRCPTARGACALAAHGWHYAACFLARLLRIAARLLYVMDAARLILGGWPMSILPRDDCAFLVAGSLRRSSQDGCATSRATMSARLRQVAGRWPTDARHVMAHVGAYKRRLVAAAHAPFCAARDFFDGGAAGRPPLRRVSGAVVTGGAYLRCVLPRAITAHRCPPPIRHGRCAIDSWWLADVYFAAR